VYAFIAVIKYNDVKLPSTLKVTENKNTKMKNCIKKNSMKKNIT